MIALKIDTLSIQSYIFGSNKLKENIGGSYIIEQLVYWEAIPKALKESGISQNVDMHEWKTDSKNYKLQTDPNASVEIGYIGGGNAVLIFREELNAQNFIKVYSRLLLQHFPGIKTAYALLDFAYESGEAYKGFNKELNKRLILNRNLHPAQTLPFKHGIVADCAWTNEAQETDYRLEGIRISKMARSRIGTLKDASAALSDKFQNQIGTDYTFSDELDKLGQPDDKGYVAIVHADGNGMGQKFIDCDCLAKTRVLSANVARYADEVVKKLISHIIENQTKLFLDDWQLDGEKKIIPIRPLIIGGDDITFVCEGRLGIYLAEQLLHFMTSTPVGDKLISACAGVAVVHTKSPFYKAYQLTEDLTKKAKEESRPDKGSWLHFMISTGGFSGSYESIVKSQYTLSDGKVLKSGPYRVGSEGDTLSSLKSGMKHFLKPQEHEGAVWPRNKQKELRDVLRKDKAFADYFLTEIRSRGLLLPGKQTEGLWVQNKTPFYDMIELLDFYPQELL